MTSLRLHDPYTLDDLSDDELEEVRRAAEQDGDKELLRDVEAVAALRAVQPAARR
jgi:hypothetical protein